MKPFLPTYLYIKTHNITGLKYFGKTTKDPFKYLGSGLYWLRHLKKHGTDITTEVVGLYEDRAECSRDAVQFSVDHNIVTDNQWANFKAENGLDGGFDFSNLPIERQHQLRSINRISGRKGAIKAQANNLIRYGSKSTLSWLNNDPNFIKKRDTKPNGHQAGQKNSQFGSMWINDGTTNRKIKKDSVIPIGFKKGRL